MKLNENVIMFTGGGTGGHIYPGLAVADEIKNSIKKSGKNVKILWIGCSKGMDRNIVEKSVDKDGNPTADKFYGIPSGKLRRYFSWQNFTDLFRIIAGYFAARRILKKEKPAVLFSKGGFVSVPPCLAARHLGIPVFTHECDFTLGLANRINFRSATKMFVSYEETKNRMVQTDRNRVIVTGNPVRPVFYNTNPQNGYKFLGIEKSELTKPVLLVLGGSSGARQINDLVFNNMDWLCSNFVVIHQTGLLNCNEESEKNYSEKYKNDYKPYQFIYKEMPDVLSCADIVLTRAGANSLWETAVLYKPMILVPLCGSGTRGDQVDNAKFFQERNAASVLLGDDANSENLITELSKLKDENIRKSYSDSLLKMVEGERPARKIADLLLEYISKD